MHHKDKDQKVESRAISSKKENCLPGKRSLACLLEMVVVEAELVDPAKLFLFLGEDLNI